MNKKCLFAVVIVLVSLICLSACGALRDTADKNKALNESLPYYELNAANYDEISYNGLTYTITDECLEMSELQEEIGQVSKRFKNVAGEDFSFGYVYSIVDVDISNAVAVNINNEYRKADIKNNDELVWFQRWEGAKEGDYSREQCYLNKENVTQFSYKGNDYTILADTVSNNELGSYIGILAENVIFNAETKIPLSKEELRKIDWYGENAGQHREQWIYKDIYEIHGTEKTEAVAVQINDRYYIAKRQ